VHVPQHELNVERLDALVGDLVRDPTRRRELAERASARGRPDAAARIAARIIESVSSVAN
jgi:UDP-N-acetylglucosamine--N-acetylmuramyl-(pentapeptide) pyrophosphoryl-undecaprenol N-acetylglucosamine transferase